MQRGLDVAAREGVEPLEKMTGPFAPAAPFGPKSFKFTAQMRKSMARLSTTQIQLQSVLLMVLVAFVMGMAFVIYGPLVAAEYRGRIERLVM